jgi:crotonobetainyl-CoA:carnitine CoA-transferase CaiB-like acyl-CoA transferase
MMARPAPLAGIRVLDFSRVLAGPHCGRMLVDLGAEVVKIEPPEGDMTRQGAPRLHSMALYFAQQNCGKRNISLDVTMTAGRDVARELAQRADVVIENFRPGVMKKLGLGYADLSATNPRLVYASISGYGQDGSWSQRGAYAMMVHAEMGYIEGESRYHQTEPQQEPYSHGDLYTSLECLSAILAALYQREHTGEGQHVDVSMAETMLCVNEHGAANLTGMTETLPLATSASPLLKTRSGRTVSVAFDPAARGPFAQWQRAMNRPDLATDPRFADDDVRRMNRAQLVELIQSWVMEFPDLTSLEAALAKAKLVMGVVRSVTEAGQTPWAKERGAVVEVSDRGGGTLKLPNSPWRFSKADSGVRGVPAYRGEHNREILRDWLQMDDARCAELEAMQVLSSRMPGSG